MLKIKNLEIVNYQRNGVHGNGFYTACFVSDGKRLMATFETDEDDTGRERINIASCRVNDRDDLRTSWRGDQYAWAIGDALKGKSPLDCCQHLQFTEEASRV